MKKYPRIRMGELEPGVFVSGVFGKAFNLTRNSLVPVMFKPEDIGLQANFQSLTDAMEAHGKMMAIWWSFIGPSSIGQFSAMNKDKKIFLIARYDVRLRGASEAEMVNDFDSSSVSVLGEEVDTTKKEAGQPTFSVLGSQFYYTGPSRFEKALFTMRIIEGDIPTDIEMKTMISEIDKSVTESSYCFQQYLVFTAFHGAMEHGNFGRLDEFDFEGIQRLGKVVVNDSRTQMLFYPGRERTNPMDFSDALCPEELSV